MPEPRWDLVIAHLPMAEKMAGRMTRPRRADFGSFYDAALDGLIRASEVWEDGPAQDPPRIFARLAHVAMRGRLLDRLKAEVRRRDRVASLSLGSLDPADPRREDDGPTLDELLAGLPERERVALLLRFREGLKRREVARRTGWHEQAVHRATASGLGRLGRILAREGRR